MKYNKKITYSIKSLLHFVTYSIFKNVKITTYSVFLHKVHHRKHQMAYGKNRSKYHCREVLPIDGEQDERQAGREGQQEDDDGTHIGRVIQRPSNVIDCDANNCGDNQGRKAKFAAALMDDETEARDGQDLEHGADGIHHRRDRIRAQDVVRCGNGEPYEVGEHHQQEEEQAPRVKAEAVLF